MVTRNEGSLDRATRVIVGVLLVLGAMSGVIGLWGYVGIVPVVTGSLGYCPAYSLFGIKTSSTNNVA